MHPKKFCRRWCVAGLSYIFVVVLCEHVLFMLRTQVIMNEKLQMNSQKLTEGVMQGSGVNVSSNSSLGVNNLKPVMDSLRGSDVKPSENLTGVTEKELIVAPPAPIVNAQQKHLIVIPTKKVLAKKPRPPPIDPKQKAIDAEKEKAFYRKKPTKVNVYKHDIIVQPRNLCSNKTYMLIIVHSFHPYRDRRDAIRKTWGMLGRGGSWPRETFPADLMRLAFIFGLHNDSSFNDMVRREAEEYDDIIMGDFMDAYVNMTLKSLLGLKYFSKYCATAKVLLKSDDDMIVNLPRLFKIIQQKNLSWSVMGPINRRSKPYRSGKWKLTVEEFPFHYFPPYESGSAYVISGDIVPKLFEASEYVPSIFIDDVYITGILGKILEIKHVAQAGFAYWLDKPPTVCDITTNRKLAGTKMTPESMKKIWEGIVKNVIKCPKVAPGRTKTIPTKAAVTKKT